MFLAFIKYVFVLNLDRNLPVRMLAHKAGPISDSLIIIIIIIAIYIAPNMIDNHL